MTRAFDLDLVLDGLRAATRAARGPDLPVVPADADPPAGAPLPWFPEVGLDAPAVLAELERLARGAARVAHPGWIAHMDPPPTSASVLGAAAAALLNNNLLAPEISPSFTALERAMAAEFAAALGLGPGSGGALTSGGTTANLLSLFVAREAALDRMATDPDGRQEALSRLTLVASAEAHVSIWKAAAVLGLHPSRGTARVEPDADGRLAPAAVDAAMDAAEARGRRCFALVPTAGTTVLGAIDPLAPLADVAAARDAWLHVDAAYAGPLALTRSRRSLLDGIERADSVTVNPHKWLYVAKACALALFRDPDAARSAMGGALPYALPGGDDPAVPTLEGTRPADVLKLRLSLLGMGRDGFEARVRRSFATAGRIEAEVARRPALALAAPRATNVVAFRFGDPEDVDDAATIELHRRLVDADVFLSLPLYRGRRWLRAVTLNPATDEATIDRLFGAVDDFAAERRSP